MAQQAAAGFLICLDGHGKGEGDDELRFRLPRACADVLSDPSHAEYDVGLVQMVPALVERARRTLPDAFRTGRGVPSVRRAGSSL